jgi:hypothetical protein
MTSYAKMLAAEVDALKRTGLPRADDKPLYA